MDQILFMYYNKHLLGIQRLQAFACVPAKEHFVLFAVIGVKKNASKKALPGTSLHFLWDFFQLCIPTLVLFEYESCKDNIESYCTYIIIAEQGPKYIRKFLFPFFFFLTSRRFSCIARNSFSRLIQAILPPYASSITFQKNPYIIPSYPLFQRSMSNSQTKE